jgi:hypothetical protein
MGIRAFPLSILMAQPRDASMRLLEFCLPWVCHTFVTSQRTAKLTTKKEHQHPWAQRSQNDTRGRLMGPGFSPYFMKGRRR